MCRKRVPNREWGSVCSRRSRLAGSSLEAAGTACSADSAELTHFHLTEQTGLFEAGQPAETTRTPGLRPFLPRGEMGSRADDRPRRLPIMWKEAFNNSPSAGEHFKNGQIVFFVQLDEKFLPFGL
ncbi:unnamed protein product [Protopolystoma xenopodis]|uniref:Uncharacterized protein n=1 Tax=Protopolystoma xenopodis TaxID=117903 RepID=A0A3S5AFT0_9PLAT|nr:unnamed protein product [Protopolystoma xenopodis]